ncbi:MAG TPA: FAD-binding oxidoreductase [Bryobacteraceae bacterium]|nr:FAD-binding oxidoreductase [Bryobacteraceae bacterium]
MQTLRPRSAEELAATMRELAASSQSVRLSGARTKDRMAGPIASAPCEVSTSLLNQVIGYDPRDLTISVGAGMRWSELTALLAENGQMIPLDPAFSASATVGGVVASNSSGPRRHLYGSARDVVIGMTFATLEGKLIQSGGNVVKNVAGLDMAKLMIGSFGTLAAIASVNFKLAPAPQHTRTFLFSCSSLQEAIAARDRVLGGVLQPAALDLLNASAAARVGLPERPTLLVGASGTHAVLGRYAKELADATDTLQGDEESRLWLKVREFTPAMLAASADAVVVRTACTLTALPGVLAQASGPAVARAGAGVVYSYTEGNASRLTGTVEFSPEAMKDKLDLWPQPGSGFAVMEKIKKLFDPGRLLNRGRLYGRI